MPQRYTVKDDRGRAITFDWDDPTPPTDADLDEIFAAAPDPEPVKAEPVKADPRSQVRLFGGEGDESLGTTIGRAVRESPIGMLGTAGEKLYGAFKAHPVESLATAGALAAVPLTAGASAGLLPAIAAAGLGGAGGAGLGLIGRQLASGVPESGVDVAREMASQGAQQAAVEGVGGLAMRGAKKLGSALYNAALGANQGLREQYPGMVARALDEGIPVTRGGRSQARQAMRASRKEADAAIEAADVAGAAPITAREVISKLGDLKPAVGTGKAATVTPKIAARARAVKAELAPSPSHPVAGLSGAEGQVLKRELDRSAEAAFSAERKGGQVAGLDPNLDKAMAEAIRDAQAARVEALTGQDLRAMNRRTQEFMGLSKALKKAVDKPHQLTNLLSLGSGLTTGLYSQDPLTGLATAAAYRGLASPTTMSHVGLGLNRAGGTELAQLLRASLLAKLAATSQGKP